MTERDELRERLQSTLDEAVKADDFVQGMCRGDYLVPGIYRRKAFLARDQAVSKVCGSKIGSRIAFMREVLAVLDESEGDDG